VRQILGKTYASLGMLDKAEPQIMAALELNRSTHGDRSPELARSLGDRASSEQQRGKSEASAASYRAALAIAVETKGPDDPLTLG
jgi:hypothetical protein